MRIQSLTALLCVLLICAPGTYAQKASDKPEDLSPRLQTEPEHWYSRFTQMYESNRIVPPIRLENSNRLDSLVRAGNLYLSLADAIALALENNIDVEVQRYNFQLSEVALARARSGGAAAGGAGAAGAGAAGGAGGAGVAAGGTGTGAAAGGGGIPSFDPVFTGNLNWAHNTQAQNNTITTGTTSLVSRQDTANFGVSQGFLTGGTANLTFNNNTTQQNAFLNNYNPTTNSFLDLQITQPLLQGFGFAMNNRNIRVAKNNLKVTDYQFQTQLVTTVNTVGQTYWSLVSANLDVESKKQSLAQAQRLYEDNQKQVEIGTLAPIEVVRAEAQVSSSETDLLTSQTNVLQQETNLKNVISRNGLASPTLASVHIIATDHITIPDVEPVRPVQDLFETALEHRPELAQTRLQLENSKINLTGTKNNLLPTISLVADLRNSGLTGSPNDIRNPATGLIPNHTVDPFFVGGYGNVLSQVFGRNFPTYSLGVQLNIPLNNRAAQNDYATAQLQLRQSELSLQKSINQIRVDVQNALIAVQQARARYQSATKTRALQEQTLDAQQTKTQPGAGTVYDVILAQRDLANAQQAEVAALTSYALAKLQLDVATGLVLDNNHVEVTEAKNGRVSRPPDPIVDVNPNGAAIRTAPKPTAAAAR